MRAHDADRRRPGAAAFALAVLVVAGCGDDDGHEGAASPEAATASVVCGHLRDQTNLLADLSNDAVRGISARSPADRSAAILAGFDATIEVARSFADGVDGWNLPDVDERGQLLADVAAGAADAVAELTDERERFEAARPSVGDADVQGAVGEFFNGIEKAMSVVEPTIGTYGRREFRASFLDEPTCEFVIQPFRLDG